ncbi:4319_t:CDS:2 [Diversispora eburnea]|uniref:Calcium-transporting ATPase n=1 Tax=Diversispora eburnea TaxID=1213867 RepID=A0A9N9B5V1_9GLOM|nr:4319_t:CDS:2 [Diversispora eburnea]
MHQECHNYNHGDYISPFAFTPQILSRLIDPKDINLLKNIGGVEGFLIGLHTNSKTGLSSHETTLNPITISDEIEGRDDKDSKSQKSVTSHPENIPFYHRIRTFGRNVLPARKQKSIFQLMWIAMHEKIIILLAIAAVISLSLGLYEDFGIKHESDHENDKPKVRWVEGVAIIVAIIIVVLVSSLNDWQKQRQFQKLNAKKEDRNVKVIRDGKESLLSVHEVLVGDILKLESGDIVSTDGVLVDAHNLKCDESAATGESDAVRKMTYEDCLKELEKNDEQEPSLLPKIDPFIISGSKVLEGVGSYVVSAVGVNSYFGKTMMALRTDPEDTPLQKKLNQLAENIAKLGGSATLIMLMVLLIKYFITFRFGVPDLSSVFQSLIRILISTVTLLVVAIPEGLPLAVTLALAFATTRMLKDNNLVRVLSACETMGNATTVCSDKTGTLTQNNMSVVAGTIGQTLNFVKDQARINDFKSSHLENPIPLQQLKEILSSDIIKLLEESIVINSTAFESMSEDGQITFTGSKTETALLSFLVNSDRRNFMDLRKNEPLKMFPFSSDRKAMGVVIEKEKSKWRFYVKGASEILLKKSKSIVNLDRSEDGDSDKIDLTEEDIIVLHEVIENYANQSLRTISLGYRDFNEWPPTGMDGEVSYDDLNKDITLLGIFGIEDPLRDGVRKAVEDCTNAGVKVRMITGDNIITAKSIATQCRIYTDGIIMEGPEFRKLLPNEMDTVVPNLQVLARSSPEDKRILVGKLRELGEIVAVTGDGTNDGPALKTADVGFSMGIAGTEVAKEASSIILMDDNFSSIVKAIMWGRSVNDAVKKFLQFQLSVNITAVLLTFISAVSNNQQEAILSAVQLLWVNLIMNTLAALALASDPPTPDLLKRKPDPRTASLISLEMWKMILGQSAVQLIITLVLLYSGNDILGYTTPEETSSLQTIIFNTFVFLQIFNEINSRRLITFGGAAFTTQKLSITQWLVCVGLGFLSIPVGIIIRLIPIRNRPQTQSSAGKLWDNITRLKKRFGDKKDKHQKGTAAVGHSEPSDQENINVVCNQSTSDDDRIEIMID